MRVRLLHATRRRSGAKALREQALDCDSIRIGRASDSHVFVNSLGVALEHAVIRREGAELRVQATSPNDLRVNGHVTTASRLRVGDVVNVGPCEIRVLTQGEDADVALEIEVRAEAVAASKAGKGRSRASLREIMPSVRTTSWLLALAIVAVFVALPLRSMRAMRVEKGGVPGRTPATESKPAGLAAMVVGSWNPGPLANAHAALTLSCESCHRERFRRVSDLACVECHANVGAHADPKVAADAFDETHLRCAECHVEHKGGDGLASLPDAMCGDCHANLKSRFSNTLLRDARDFDAQHPEFRPSVVTTAGSAERARVEVLPGRTADERSLVEHSGLKFSHEKHLKPMQRKDSLTGKSIESPPRKCADCHVPDSSGALMEPVAYARNCADAACHALGFDNDFPDRVAPHAKPELVRRSVEEFFAGRALAGDRGQPQAEVAPRRRPGLDGFSEADRLAAKAWADERSAKALAALLSLGSDGPCMKCHTLTADGAEPVVTPVHVVPFEGGERWLPLARFTHARHTQLDCERCHDVRTSGSSEHVLLPSIGVCRECHGGETATLERIASPCLQCHGFHDKRRGPMRSVPADSASATLGEQAK